MEKVRFDDFIKLNRGFDLPDNLIEEGIYPVVASTNIKAYHREYKVDGPMVITGRSGSLGKVQYINGKCWPLNTSLYVKDFKGNNPRYVYYYLKTMHLEQYNAGAGVPTLNQNHLHSLKLLVHSKERQKEVATILSTYDTLIENNTKRIHLLEKMAENLYKEWFVRFRFPGYEKVEMENGLPKGWKVESLGNLLDIRYGKDHKKLDDGDIPIYGSGGIMRYGDTALYEGCSVLIPRKGSLNNIIYVEGKFWTVDTMFYSVPKKNNICFYMYYVLSLVDMTTYNAGAALPSMTTSILNRMKVVLPDRDVLMRFDGLMQANYKQKCNLQHQNSLLVRQRDLLLPRLMSGKLEVKP